MVPRFFQRNRVLLTVGVAVLLIAGTLVMMLTGGSEEAPEFSATSTGYIDGEESNRTIIKLSDYRGQVVILDLMAEWCGPCKEVASGTLKPLYKEEYRASDKVVIISVSIANDSLDLLEDMQREYGYDWLHVTNNDLDVITKYNAQHIPTGVVIAQQGRMTFAALGSVKQDKLQREVESALSGEGSLEKVKQNSIFLMAIGAGALSFFSPCSFPLLPGYVSFYLTTRKTGSKGLNERTAREALPAGLAAASGILVVLLLLALLVVPFSHLLADYVPLLELLVGAAVFVLGVSMLLEWSLEPLLRPLRQLSSALGAAAGMVTRGYPTALTERGIRRVTGSDFSFAASREAGLTGQFWYGVGYGSASAGCTAPVFITLILASLKYTLAGALLVFSLYAFSAAALMVAFTLLIASSESTIVDRLRASTRHIHIVGGAVMVIVGVYLVWFYLSISTSLL